MAITRTARFSLHRWDSGGDAMNRAQFDIDNLQVETLAAIFRTGQDASKPAAGDPSSAKTFYAATDTGIIYYNNNGTWVSLNDYGETADISTMEIGAAGSAGSGTEIALANHVHPVGTPSTPASVGTTAATGSSLVPSRADHVHVIGANAVIESTIAANAVVEGKIAAGAVTETKIGTGAVTDTKLASNAVTEAKIAVGAVTPLKIGSAIAGNGLERNVGTGVLTVKAGSGVIVDASGVSIDASGITAGNIADDSISTAKIQNNAVIDTKIATDAVTPLKIAAGIVGNGLSRNAGTGVISVAASTGITVGAGGVSVTALGITDALIAANAVTEAKINANAVTETKIGTGAVTPLKIASTIVGTGSSSAGLERNVGTGVLGLKIGSTLVFDGTTGAVGVAAGGITDTQLGVAAVTPLKIDASLVGNGLTRNGTTGVISVAASTGITVGAGGVSITAGGVTDTQLANGAVTSAKLLQTAGSEAVITAAIRNDAVTSLKIANDAVTPLKISSTFAGNGLTRDGGTGVVSVLASTGITVGAGGVSITALGVTEGLIGPAAVTEAKLGTGAVTALKAGSGVYVNHMTNGSATGQKIRYTAEASLPADNSTATGYAAGDIWFGY